MSDIIRKTIFVAETKHEVSLASLDFSCFRRALSPLFERAASAVQLAGFEQDDAEIVQSVGVEIAGIGQKLFPLDALADRSIWERSLMTLIHADCGTQVTANDVFVRSLRVEAILEQWCE